MAVNGVEIKVGQKWRSRKGEIVTIREEDDLIELIEDVPPANPFAPGGVADQMVADSKEIGEAIERHQQALLTPEQHAEIEGALPSGPQAPTAPALLDAAAKHMRDRAATYDKPEGERSMATTVEAFNAVTGRDLRESEGWLLMNLLKLVRSEQRGMPHQDSVEDAVAYSALYGEARLGGR